MVSSENLRTAFSIALSGKDHLQVGLAAVLAMEDLLMVNPNREPDDADFYFLPIEQQSNFEALSDKFNAALSNMANDDRSVLTASLRLMKLSPFVNNEIEKICAVS